MKRTSHPGLVVMIFTICGALQYTGPVGNETKKGGKVYRVKSPKRFKKKARKKAPASKKKAAKKK